MLFRFSLVFFECFAGRPETSGWAKTAKASEFYLSMTLPLSYKLVGPLLLLTSYRQTNLAEVSVQVCVVFVVCVFSASSFRFRAPPRLEENDEGTRILFVYIVAA